MTGYSDIYTADLRGSVLVILESADCETSLGILRTALARATPHNPALDTLRMELRWLANHSLVELRRIDGVIEGVIVTELGADVAHGRKDIAGVSLPREAP